MRESVPWLWCDCVDEKKKDERVTLMDGMGNGEGARVYKVGEVSIQVFQKLKESPTTLCVTLTQPLSTVGFDYFLSRLSISMRCPN